jgi:hypothetical protein
MPTATGRARPRTGRHRPGFESEPSVVVSRAHPPAGTGRTGPEPFASRAHSLGHSSVVSRVHRRRTERDRHGPSGRYEPPYQGSGEPPAAPRFCEECRAHLAPSDDYCTMCGTPVPRESAPEPFAALAESVPEPEPVTKPVRLTRDAYGDPARPAEEGAPDGDGTPLPPLAGARIWCPRDTAARAGSAVPVRFAIAAVPGADPDVPPLAEPVALRVLLESDAAAVRPVTRRTELRRDRTSEAVEFAVVPEQAGSAVLLFSVYRDRDGQLLQQVSAELPVGEAESDRTGAEVG